jgi:hypothetical protein
MGSPIRVAGSVRGISWDFDIVSFHKMGFGHQEHVYFLGVEKYFGFLYALCQPVYIQRCYTVLYARIILPVCDYGGEKIHERAHSFSLFGHDCFEPCEGLLHYFD